MTQFDLVIIVMNIRLVVLRLYGYMVIRLGRWKIFVLHYFDEQF